MAHNGHLTNMLEPDPPMMPSTSATSNKTRRTEVNREDPFRLPLRQPLQPDLVLDHDVPSFTGDHAILFEVGDAPDQ